MRAIFRFFKRFVLYVKYDYQLRKAVMLADSLYKKNGGQYFVLPDAYKNLIVMTWKQYKALRSKKKAAFAYKDDIYRECFYCTLWKQNMHLNQVGIDAKRKMYFEYMMR